MRSGLAESRGRWDYGKSTIPRPISPRKKRGVSSRAGSPPSRWQPAKGEKENKVRQTPQRSQARLRSLPRKSTGVQYRD